MSVTCPCCKANNDSGPHCRRCKADLGLLTQYREQQIVEAKERAVEAAIAGDFAAALIAYYEAR